MRVRFPLFMALLLVAVLTLFVFLLATDTALSVWQRMAAAPLWLQVAYASLLVIFSGVSLWLAWCWLKPAAKKAEKKSRAVDPLALQDNLVDSAQAGVDVSTAVAEIREQQKRKQSGEVFIAIFGEISTGKSSLVKALLPEADPHGGQLKSDPRGGTTLKIKHYRWRSPSGDAVVITDLPGFNLEANPEILEEARRAHLVVFMCDSDMTRSQMEQLENLQKLKKPLIIALNKLDQFSTAEAQAITKNISQQTGIDQEDVIFIQSGGREEVIRLLNDGEEETVERQRPTNIGALRNALQRHLDDDAELLEQLRDTAILMLASEKLELARNAHREQEAAELVQSYSRRAVVGALAAVAPGTDLIIQGLLATRLIKALCNLYETPLKEVEIESFIRLAGGRVKQMTAITLAITGNALKAFPGVGTLTGGMIHAVAYGMIFDSLGRAAAETLASRGELRPYPAVKAFEEILNENLEAGALGFAKIALAEKNKTGKS